MEFEAFDLAARATYEEIPEAFKRGVDGLVVSREAPAHPDHPDVFTLGLCLTEDHLSDYGGPDTTRSRIALYWGSFRELAKRDPQFDWSGELWETLTHELRHHLESLAGEDDLEAVDYAAEETFKRDEGFDFDPWYYQHGEPVKPGTFRVETSWYLEQLWSAEDFVRATHVDFEWEGAALRVARPDELGDVHFVWIDGAELEHATLELVLVRKRSWREDVKRLAGSSRPVVYESRAVAEPAIGGG
jgi:hypothetical protein